MTATVYTATGKAWVVDRIDGTIATATWYIGWGTGGSSTGSTATGTETALQAEATEARSAATVSQPAADTNQWVATLTNQKAGGKTVEEAGVFTASTSGVLIIRTTHGGVALATGDSIQYTFTLQQT
jgi:hypothetical protein